MQIMHSRALRCALLVGFAATGTVAVTAQSQAALPEHPGVVMRTAMEDFTQLVPTSGPRPRIDDFAESGNTVFAGGVFQRVRDLSGQQDIRNIVAVDETTGQVRRSFDLDVDAPVEALASSGNDLYVGGAFRTANGLSRPYLVKVDATTGEVDTGFRPPLKGRVADLQLAKGMLFVSGPFRQRLVALNPATGADTGYVNVDVLGDLPCINRPGSHIQPQTCPQPTAAGTTNIYDFSINPQATRLVAVGNFITVNAQARARAFMLNLGDTSATLSDWYYDPFARPCWSVSPIRIAYLNQVDFSPAGDYFAVVSTGYIPRWPADHGSTVCDAAARFNTNELDPQRPAWINYTGGDTLTGVLVSGPAVYVQGHNRWLDNPQGADSEGPGAVKRPGIGAIDPTTGLALPWNPRKPAQRGGEGFLTTENGLWVGSDSSRFSGDILHGMAFAPLP